MRSGFKTQRILVFKNLVAKETLSPILPHHYVINETP